MAFHGRERGFTGENGISQERERDFKGDHRILRENTGFNGRERDFTGESGISRETTGFYGRERDDGILGSKCAWGLIVYPINCSIGQWASYATHHHMVYVP